MDELSSACGAMYLSLKLRLSERIYRWHIVETPAMAEVGKNLFQDEHLRFYADLNAAAQVARRDLLWAQAVVQYTRDLSCTWNDLF